MTLVAKKELAKLAFTVLLALNVVMTLLHTYHVAQERAVRVLSGVIAAGLLVALAAWIVLALRVKRTRPAQID